MPTSVLLAVLAAAVLLALAPALVRRYDATERLVAERALSTARVLARAGSPRPGRKRTTPGRRPVNPPRAYMTASVGSGTDGGSGAADGDPGVVDGDPGARSEPAKPRGVGSAPEGGGPGRRVGGRPGARPAGRRNAPAPRAVYRRRRVLLALAVFNLVELVGVVFVGPGFWIGAALGGSLMLAYLVHLRNRALTEQRRRRAEARYAAWVAARQAVVRKEQARRAAAKRAALEEQFAERDRMRREAARLSSVRGRPYSSRAVGQ